MHSSIYIFAQKDSKSLNKRIKLLQSKSKGDPEKVNIPEVKENIYKEMSSYDDFEKELFNITE